MNTENDTREQRVLRPVIGRKVATRDSIDWDWQVHSHLTVRGDAMGKTNLARGIARQWAGPVLVLGRTHEWDVDEHQVEHYLDSAITALEALANGATEPSLVVVDGLDDHVVDGADSEDIERLHSLLRRLSTTENVHLVVITRTEKVECCVEGLNILADSRLTPYSGHLLLRQNEHVVIEVSVPFVGPPGWEIRR